MLDIKFKINGKPVEPGKLADTFMNSVLNNIKEMIAKDIGSIKCPAHSKPSKIIVEGKDLNHLSLTIEGCCEEFENMVREKYSD